MISRPERKKAWQRKYQVIKAIPGKTKSIKLMPAANAEIPFEFDFAKPAPGKYKLVVEAMITDSKPLDNSDSAAITNQ